MEATVKQKVRPGEAQPWSFPLARQARGHSLVLADGQRIAGCRTPHSHARGGINPRAREGRCPGPGGRSALREGARLGTRGFSEPANKQGEGFARVGGKRSSLSQGFSRPWSRLSGRWFVIRASGFFRAWIFRHSSLEHTNTKRSGWTRAAPLKRTPLGRCRTPISTQGPAEIHRGCSGAIRR